MEDHWPGGNRPLTLVEGFRRCDRSLEQLHTDYLAMGGTLTVRQLDRVLSGTRQPGRYEHNKLAAALNEYFLDAGDNHPVGYDDSPLPEDRR